MRIGLGLSLAACLVSADAHAEVHFRDLNHNGQLDPYEDARLPIDRRLDDLLSRMTLEEKVGAMMHGSLPAGDTLGHGSQTYDLSATEPMIADRHLNSFITRLVVSPEQLAQQNNAIQHLAERTRLGIPVTISTDPRNHFQAVLGASRSRGSSAPMSRVFKVPATA